MATGLENLDEGALRAKLEEATSYEERAAIRQALRSLKKERGEQVGGHKGARRGASYYNRFAGASRSGSVAKSPQSFIPSGPKSPTVAGARSVTPTRAQGSTTPTSRAQRVPTPISPGPSAAAAEEEMQRQREMEERKRQREEERREREKQEDERRRREEEERARELEMEAERQLQREQERQELERQQEEEESRLQREEEERALQKEEEDSELREEQAEGGHQEDEEGSEEGPKSPPSTPVEKEETGWVVVDKSRAQQLEKEATALLDQEEQTDDGEGQSFGVQLRTTRSAKPPPAREALEPKAEFQKFQLRKTQSTSANKAAAADPPPSSVSNFGVKLKSWETTSHAPGATGGATGAAHHQRTRAQTYVTSAGHKNVPGFSPKRGVGSFQRGSSATQVNIPRDSSPQAGLVAYVNAALQLHPPLSPTSSALYETCSNPSLLCKLINKSVRNTVDLRALTRTPPPSQVASREEALQENMTLVIESARAIGCRVDDDMGQRILNKDQETIRGFLQDLIRARVVHMPGMDDEPASTFENVMLMLEKLGISGSNNEETDQPLSSTVAVPSNGVSPSHSTGSGRAETASIDPSPSYQPSMASVGPDKPSLDADLTYEERAARRRAERERRRREREALATAK